MTYLLTLYLKIILFSSWNDRDSLIYVSIPFLLGVSFSKNERIWSTDHRNVYWTIFMDKFPSTLVEK